MIRLTKEQLLLMHEALIARYGGTHGIRDEGLLDSALNAPFQGYAGVDFDPSVVSNAVRLFAAPPPEEHVIRRYFVRLWLWGMQLY